MARSPVASAWVRAKDHAGLVPIYGWRLSPPAARVNATSCSKAAPCSQARPTSQAVSTGAACASRKGTKSPVLQAMGLSEERVDSALRFSLSRETTEDDIAGALTALKEALNTLRSKGLV